MDYIGEGGSLPVPLNILGGPRAFLRGFWRVCCKCSSEDEFENPPPNSSTKSNVISNNTAHEHNASSMENGGHPVDISAVEIYETNLRPEDMDRRRSTSGFNEQINYQKVIQTIIQRYIFDIQREAEVTEDDFEEIKQDISSFRYEMLNNMQVREAESVEIQEMLKTILSILTNQEEGYNADFKKTQSVTAADRLKFKSFVAAKMAKSNSHVFSED